MLYVCFFFFFFKQKTAYEMRISDWSSDVCSSDLDMKGVEMRLLRFACVALLGGLMIPTNALAEKRSYDMTIEDTKINLVDNQDFHTFAFNGQVDRKSVV